MKHIKNITVAKAQIDGVGDVLSSIMAFFTELLGQFKKQ